MVKNLSISLLDKLHVILSLILPQLLIKFSYKSFTTKSPTSQFEKMGISVQIMTTSWFRFAHNLVFRERSLSREGISERCSTEWASVLSVESTIYIVRYKIIGFESRSFKLPVLWGLNQCSCELSNFNNLGGRLRPESVHGMEWNMHRVSNYFVDRGYVHISNKLTNQLNNLLTIPSYWKPWKTESIGSGSKTPLNTLICRLIPGLSEMPHIS